jgi:hypothetical protein
MDTEKMQYGNGQDNSRSEEKRPIIDQMTDLAAEAAGTLAETAVKAALDQGKRNRKHHAYDRLKESM